MPPALYVGATSGYSGKSMLAVGLGLYYQKQGLDVGYFKPVGAQPYADGTTPGDRDSVFVADVLGVAADPALLTPVLVTEDFKKKAFAGETGDLRVPIRDAFETLSENKDLMIVAGSGSMYSGRYCGVDGVSLCREFGWSAVVLDRMKSELAYDELTALGEALGDLLAGVVPNDVPAAFIPEIDTLLTPLLSRFGVRVLGIIPRDALLGSIKVADLAEKLNARIITAKDRTEGMVESFLIGTMQMENFLPYFKRADNPAVIMGGDRSDIQLVALSGGCSCLILTGNLYPNDVILTRAEVAGIPIMVVKQDTYSVARAMEDLLARHKLRDHIKIRQAANLVQSCLDLAGLSRTLGLDL